MAQRYEVRHNLRYGSRHEKWFADEVAALAYVEDQINGRGLIGAGYKRVDDVFYYSIYPDDDI